MNTIGSVAAAPVAETAAPREAVMGWRRIYFGSPANRIVTVLCLVGLCYLAFIAFRWLVFDAVFAGTPAECKASDGACWQFIADKLRYMVFGFYPLTEQWRPTVALVLLFGASGYSMVPANWSGRLLAVWIVGILPAFYILLAGGVPGLPVVSSSQWGGLPLSLLLAVFGLACALPLGILLALARTSNLPAIRVIVLVFIEAVRGVPLITILFMATVMLPLFLPAGLTPGKLAAAITAFIVFAAAYVAETVRGGLQGVPTGQIEAGRALGLHYWSIMRHIVLPQALRKVMPPLVSLFIGFFQDTTLVTIIGLLDFLNTVRSSLRDPEWQGIVVLEGYLFAAAVYFLFSALFGAYGRFLERRFKV